MLSKTLKIISIGFRFCNTYNIKTFLVPKQRREKKIAQSAILNNQFDLRKTK